MNGRKIAFKPVGILAGLAGSALFSRAWSKFDKGRDVPESTDTTRTWGEVLVAAALQGAVFAVIHAIVERASVKPQTIGLGHDGDGD